MTENQSNKSIIKGILILSMVIYYMELILRIKTKSNFFNLGLLYSLILALVVSATVYFISSFFKKKRKTILIILTIFITYLYASQMVYFDIFKTFYSVYSAAKAMKAIGFIKDLIYKIFVNLHWIILLSGPSMIYIRRVYKNKENFKTTWLSRIVIICFTLVLIYGINYNIEVEGDMWSSSSNMSFQISEPIMAVNRLAVDEEITPTLYKIQNEGYNFTNFFNPLWGVSTLDGEYVAINGLLPKPGVWSMYETIDKPVSSLDILPTIMNLMELEYDSRLLIGRDIFSDSPPLIMFHNRSFITDKGMYNSVTEEFIPNEGVTLEEDYIEKILEKIERRFYYSEQILDKDYYSIVVE